MYNKEIKTFFMYEIISQYLEYLELEKGLAQNTIDAYRRDLYSFAESYKSINSVDRNSINTFIRKLKEKKLAPTSIIRKIASLRGFFKWTFSMNILDKNPASTLEQPKVPLRLPKVITLRDIETREKEIEQLAKEASPDTAVQTLNTLYLKKHISKPEFVCSVSSDEDGNQVWRCECFIAEYEDSEGYDQAGIGEEYTKAKAKQAAAYDMICFMLGKENDT